MLMRQVRILLLVSELQQQRMRPDQMASELRLQPFVVKKAVEQIRGFTPADWCACTINWCSLTTPPKRGGRRPR